MFQLLFFSFLEDNDQEFLAEVPEARWKKPW